jgi:ActR/RegA family two-component response regulator
LGGNEKQGGDQARLEQMRCVDHSTVSQWRRICDVVEVIKKGNVGYPTFEHFQPSHADEIARAFRKREREPEKWTEEMKQSEERTVITLLAPFPSVTTSEASYPGARPFSTPPVRGLILRGVF